MRSLILALALAWAAAAFAELGQPVKLYGPRTGIASFYGSKRSPALTAAHRFLPFGTHVKVTNTRNGRSVVVAINDRGPFIKGRVIDVSYAAAKKLGMISSGITPVKLSIVKAPPGHKVVHHR